MSVSVSVGVVYMSVYMLSVYVFSGSSSSSLMNKDCSGWKDAGHGWGWLPLGEPVDGGGWTFAMACVVIL
jgi:hypothetical protein